VISGLRCEADENCAHWVITQRSMVTQKSAVPKSN